MHFYSTNTSLKLPEGFEHSHKGQSMIMKSLILTAALLDGLYQMDLTVGDHLFKDFLLLKGANKPLSLQAFDGPITGTVTVPGVFTSDLKGHAKCSEKTSTCHLHFVVVAHEGGRDFKVFYRAEVTRKNYLKAISNNQPAILTGTATLENGQPLGPFVATRYHGN
jgi:hypothetical protein